jgi:hypothetical protein
VFDFSDFTLNSIAPTAMGAPALIDRIELLRSLEENKWFSKPNDFD